MAQTFGQHCVVKIHLSAMRVIRPGGCTYLYAGRHGRANPPDR